MRQVLSGKIFPRLTAEVSRGIMSLSLNTPGVCLAGGKDQRESTAAARELVGNRLRTGQE